MVINCDSWHDTLLYQIIVSKEIHFENFGGPRERGREKKGGGEVEREWDGQTAM